MIESAPYYWLRCDHCGTREPREDDDILAWASEDQAIASAADAGWESLERAWLCSSCSGMWLDALDELMPAAQAGGRLPRAQIVQGVDGLEAVWLVNGRMLTLGIDQDGEWMLAESVGEGAPIFTHGTIEKGFSDWVVERVHGVLREMAEALP